MFSILCATDLSAGADEALRQADELARLFDAGLEVLHVVPSPFRTYPLFPQLHQREVATLPGLLEHAAGLLQERVAAITGRSPEETTLVVRDGFPYAVVVERALETGADLLIVGAVGSGAVSPHRLGAVAEKVLRYAHCPVLVARPGPGTRTILAATDLSDPSLPAITTAAELARLLGGSLTVVHNLDISTQVVAWGMDMPIIPAISYETLDRLASEAREHLLEALERHSVAAEAVVTRGLPSAAILELAAKLAARLVVVGTRGRTGLARVLLGSVASDVAREAPCSVLAVRLHRNGKDGS